jgi:hypothetical protein
MYGVQEDRDRERNGEHVLGTLGSGGVAAVTGVVALGVREWRRVQLARERRRVREQESIARMVAGMAGEGRQVRVRHHGADGDWSVQSEARGRRR